MRIWEPRLALCRTFLCWWWGKILQGPNTGAELSTGDLVHQQEKWWTRLRVPPSSHLGAEGEEIKASQIILLGGVSRDQDWAAEWCFCSIVWGAVIAPKLRWMMFRAVCKGIWGPQVKLLMPLGLWQDAMDTPLLQDLLSDIGIVTQPDVSRIVFSNTLSMMPLLTQLSRCLQFCFTRINIHN